MSTQHRTIRIGTRGSPLALRQVEMVREALAEAFPDIETETVVIKTSGDWTPEQGEVRLSEADGGKGQFAKEIEEALLACEIDVAVHSMKDMDSNLPEGLVIDHMLPREDARDALLFGHKIKYLADNSQIKGKEFDILPKGAVVGTSSVRRAAFMLAERPDLQIVPFRGNLQTRIDKLADENYLPQVDCTFLAMAGLKRLGFEHHADLALGVEAMLPAAGQGAVGLQVRFDDGAMLSIFSQISDLNTVFCVKAEREVLRVLDGSCHTPIGAYAELESGKMWLRVRVCSEDGQQSFEDEIRGVVKTSEQAIELGYEIGTRLKAIVPEGILGRG